MYARALVPLLLASVTASPWRADKYPCVLCDHLVESLIDGKAFDDVCTRVGACDFLAPYRNSTEGDVHMHLPGGFEIWGQVPTQARDVIVRTVCETAGLCAAEDEETAVTASTPDVRVTPVLAKRGYNFVRVSMIDDASSATQPDTTPADLFTYSKQFQYRWTNMRLNSGLLAISPGNTTSVTIGGTTFDILLPSEGQGVRGIVIADPCYSGKWVSCQFGAKLQTFDRITGFLNAAAAVPASEGGIDFFMILGDNFYDRTGKLTTKFFSALSAQAKAKLFAAAPGNHDYWVGGSPMIQSQKKDQFGNGFMQYYAMDVMAGANDAVNFLDFSQNPSKGSGYMKKNLPKASNFQSYFKIGNLAFISYSGAYSDKEQTPFLKEACKWLGEQKDVMSAFVIGHWNDGGLGCADGMSVPQVRAKVEAIDGCGEYSDRLKYLMGHTHCNQVTETNVGFMVAGMGMEGCGNFGVPVVDTTNGTTQVLYYPIQESSSSTDKYAVIEECFRTKGVGNCKDLASSWAE